MQMSESILQENFEILRKQPVFERVPFHAIKLYALMAQRIVYQAGETIFSQGQTNDRAYLILAGRVQLYMEHRKNRYDLQVLEVNRFFGYMALLADLEARLGARAIERTELLTIDRASFRKLWVQHPEVCMDIVEKMIQNRMQMMHLHMQRLLDATSNRDEIMRLGKGMGL